MNISQQLKRGKQLHNGPNLSELTRHQQAGDGQKMRRTFLMKVILILSMHWIKIDDT